MAFACFAIGTIAIGIAGCYKPADSTVVSIRTPGTLAATNPAPATAPSPLTLLFDDKKDGVQFQYTSNWVSRPDQDYVLQLAPVDASSNGRILFDVPDLPPHFPGMIRLGLIENGYANDLKDTHKDARTDCSTNHSMPDGAQARLVESSWTQDGSLFKDIALLIMRNDRVYILSCRSDLAHLAATRADFDKVAASLHWTK